MRNPRIDLVVLVVAVVALLPEVLLGANTIGGRRIDGVTVAVELLTVVAGLALGLSAAGLFLHSRNRGRAATAWATAVALLTVAAGFVLANIWPPPYIAAYEAAGVPTLNGLLNAAYIALIFGAAAAALRLAWHSIRLRTSARLRT